VAALETPEAVLAADTDDHHGFGSGFFPRDCGSAQCAKAISLESTLPAHLDRDSNPIKTAA